MPELWFSYHVYHKAPDWLGPAIAGALGIPYVVAEASVTPRQVLGPWAVGHRAAECAIRRADAVIGLNSSDRECVLPLLRDPWRWVAFKPFLDAASYGRKGQSEVGPPRLITVAMMRHGDKLASYRILGDALSRLLDLPWSLEVVGDGPARTDVENALAAVSDRVSWTGSLGHTSDRRTAGLGGSFRLARHQRSLRHGAARGAGEWVARGGRSGRRGWGNRRIRGSPGCSSPPGDALAFAAAVRSLILDRGRRAAFAEAARRRVLLEHDLPAAARRLAAVIDALGRDCAA